MFSKDGLIRERRAVFIAALVPVGMDSKLRTRYNYREAGFKMSENKTPSRPEPPPILLFLYLMIRNRPK